MTNPHNPAEIKANIPALRAVAAQLTSVAQDIEAVIPALRSVQTTARQDASTNTVDGGPAPIFSPLLNALGAATAKVGSNITQLHQNVTGDAAALKKLADDIEGVDHGHGQAITNISTT